MLGWLPDLWRYVSYSLRSAGKNEGDIYGNLAACEQLRSKVRMYVGSMYADQSHTRIVTTESKLPDYNGCAGPL